MLEGLEGLISQMTIVSAVVGLIIVVVLRKVFSKLSIGKQVAVVGVAAVVVVLLFPALMSNPVGEATAMVNSGREWASSMGFSFIGFLIGAAGGVVAPIG